MKTYTIIEKGDVFIKQQSGERFVVLTEDCSEGRDSNEKFAVFNIDKEYHIVFLRVYLLEEMEYRGNISKKLVKAQNEMGKILRGE